MQVYENVTKCQPTYNKLITMGLKDLLDKIFVSDPEVRISIAQIKEHQIFEGFDFDVSLSQRFKASAPYIPKEATYFEYADRKSEEVPLEKPKNILAAIMGNPTTEEKQM